MIKLINYSFTYPTAKNKTLDNINLHIREGECVLICGKSGCGKSTLSRILNGLCPKFYAGESLGKYILCNKQIEDFSLDEIGTKIGSVFQDPRSQFFAKRVRDEIVLAMENNCFSREVMQERLEDIIQTLGINHLYNRNIVDSAFTPTISQVMPYKKA